VLEPHGVTPDNTYKVGGSRQVIYTPVIAVEDTQQPRLDHAGRTSRVLHGDVACKGEMRGRMREVCKAPRIVLETAGTALSGVTRTTSHAIGMKAYFAPFDGRFKFFRPPYPTSAPIGVACLAMPEMLAEAGPEAIIEASRLRPPKTGLATR